MSRKLEIKSIAFYSATSPQSRPIADSTHSIGEIRFIVCRTETTAGHRGEGYLLSFDYSNRAIEGALEDIAPLALGHDAGDIGLFIRKWGEASEYFGTQGVNNWALGAVNIAMWDTLARSLGIPVWKMFGVHARKVPLYGSGGWLSYSIDELVEEALSYARRGFRAVKVKVGSQEPQRDVERIAKLREQLGREVRIMMDANQGLGFVEALHLARRVEPYDIHWFEEPLRHTDYDDYAKLKAGASCAIAMGEREYDLVALRELSARKALDLWQPDIMRLGGVDGWRASAHVAELHGIPVLPHFYREYDVPLLCTIPNGYGAESFDWTDGLIDRPLRYEEGFAYPNEEPGWGFTFRDQYLTEIGRWEAQS